MTLLWDVRSAMEEKESRTIQGIIEKHKNKKSYYIFIHANWTDHAMSRMKTTYMLRSTKPPKMLGTKLYYVDNDKGALSKEWELPMDLIVPMDLLDMSKSSEGVMDSVKSIAPVVQMS